MKSNLPERTYQTHDSSKLSCKAHQCDGDVKTKVRCKGKGFLCEHVQLYGNTRRWQKQNDIEFQDLTSRTEIVCLESGRTCMVPYSQHFSIIRKLSRRDLGYGGQNTSPSSISVHRMTVFCTHTTSWFKMETSA